MRFRSPTLCVTICKPVLERSACTMSLRSKRILLVMAKQAGAAAAAAMLEIRRESASATMLDVTGTNTRLHVTPI